MVYHYPGNEIVYPDKAVEQIWYYYSGKIDDSYKGWAIFYAVEGMGEFL